MKLHDIKDIIELAKKEGLTEFAMEEKEFKLSFSFVGNQVAAPTYMPQAPVQPVAAAKSEVKVVAAADTNLHTVKSPFVGTFYGSPAPGKPVYVKVGDKVKVGQALCVLEAMKIMNEIDADVAGEIVEICVDNESLVEFAQPLFKIKTK